MKATKKKRGRGAPVKEGGKFNVMAVSITDAEKKSLNKNIEKVNNGLAENKLTKSQLMKYAINRLDEIARIAEPEKVYKYFTNQK